VARPQKITNEAILSVARQAFLERGFGASTLVIAERAGIAEASIFKRFTTKQALFLAAMGVTETPQWIKDLSNHEPTENIKDELIIICDQMMAFYQEVLPQVMVMMGQGHLPPFGLDPLQLGKFVPPPIRDAQVLAQYLEKAILAGYMRSCDPVVTAHMIVGAINNYVVVQHVIGKMPFSPPSPGISVTEQSQFVRQLIESVWVGVSPL
jgi:AcrR family transcriptional regulator